MRGGRASGEGSGHGTGQLVRSSTACVRARLGRDDHLFRGRSPEKTGKPPGNVTQGTY